MHLSRQGMWNSILNEVRDTAAYNSNKTCASKTGHELACTCAAGACYRGNNA